MKSEILNLHKQYLDGTLKPSDVAKIAVEKLKSVMHLNPIITDLSEMFLNEANRLDNFEQNKDNLLYGIPYSLKDMYCTKNIVTTGGSRFLKNFVPSYDSSVYVKLKSLNSMLIAKDNNDEFGLGGTGTFSGFGIVKNNYDETRIPGGSSSGSAVMVAAGVVPFAMGTDTGDSVRRPASFVGIVGFKPTYGLIPKYGVMPYAPSLDHCGIFTRNVIDCAIVSSNLMFYDKRDFSNNKEFGPEITYMEYGKSDKTKKFVVLRNILNLLDDDKKKVFENFTMELASKGHTIDYVNVDINLIKALSSTYKAISYAEAFSCYGSMQGFLFGDNVARESTNYEEILYRNRSEHFGPELKRRFVIGSYITNKENYHDFYLKAKKVRTIINDFTNKLLTKYDCLIMPTSCDVAPKIEDVGKPNPANIVDDTHMLGNFAGTPSITIPFTKFNGMPFGITLTSHVYTDNMLLDVAYELETIIDSGGYNE